ncbi:MAG: GIY-YIG nuclease family protein [Paraclostridium sp.]
MKIYKITNMINGNIYIGATKLELEERIRMHFNHARTIKKQKIHIAMNEYGFNNFKIELLEEVKNGKIAENFYIKKFLEQGFTLYNEQKKSCISTCFYSYDIHSKVIEKHEKVDSKIYNPGRVSEVLNKTKSIVNNKKYERFSYKNKLWSYENNEENWNILLKKNKNKTTMCNPKKVRIIETGVIFNSQKEANEYFGSPSRSTKIGNAIKNGYKTHGYHWEYVN